MTGDSEYDDDDEEEAEEEEYVVEEHVEEEIDPDEWMYEDEEPDHKSIPEKFRAWVKKKAEKRRHPTLVYFEKRDIMDAHGNKIDKEVGRLKAKKKMQKKIKNKILDQRQKDFEKEVKRLDRERFNREFKQREQDFVAGKLRMNLFEKWGIEADERKEKEREEFRKSEERRILKEKEDKRQADR